MAAFVRSFNFVRYGNYGNVLLPQFTRYSLVIFRPPLAPLSDYHRTNNCDHSSVMRFFAMSSCIIFPIADSLDECRMSTLTVGY